jgi:hypothetical protein
MRSIECLDSSSITCPVSKALTGVQISLDATLDR